MCFSLTIKFIAAKLPNFGNEFLLFHDFFEKISASTEISELLNYVKYENPTRNFT